MAQVPVRVGDYEVRGILGAGATGTVFLAYQEIMDREVALKQLRTELSRDPAFHEQFRTEAALMARLDDPNCVRVFDFFDRDDHAYLVTEVIDGASLRKLVEHAGRLTPEQSLGVLKGGLKGLERAHELGVVHRDIKPENVLLDRQGVSKLADFGQAQIAAGPGAAGGMPTGSPAYMSPETVSGGEVGPRSDIYSAGAVLYELLTGRPPFLADSPLAVMRMQRDEPVPDPRSINPEMAPEMAGLVMAALAKDPGERPQSAAEMLAALETAAVAAYGKDWEKRSSVKREVAAAIGAGLGLLAGLGVAGAAAAAAALGEAMTAAAAGGASGSAATGFLGLSTWAVAAVLAAILLLGGGVYAVSHGIFRSGNTSTASPGTSPANGSNPSPSGSTASSPSSVTSPSPSPSGEATPSPAPGPGVAPSPTPNNGSLARNRGSSNGPSNLSRLGPAASPSPSQVFNLAGPFVAPQPPGPVTVSGLRLGFQQCDTSAGTCSAPQDVSQFQQFNSCGPYIQMRLLESYSYSYAGGPGPDVAITVNWITSYNENASHTSETANAGTSRRHLYDPQTAFVVGSRTATVTYELTWTNPDGSSGSAKSPASFTDNNCSTPG